MAISSDYKRDTVVTAKGEPLAPRLRERLLRSAHVMTAEEENRFLKGGYEPYTKYDYRPTGELRLSAIRLDYRHTEKDWADNKRKKLEHQVGTIVVGLEALVEKIRQERIEREEAHRRWQEEARRREEDKRRREEEAKRFEQLRQGAAHSLIGERRGCSADTSVLLRRRCRTSSRVPTWRSGSRGRANDRAARRARLRVAVE